MREGEQKRLTCVVLLSASCISKAEQSFQYKHRSVDHLLSLLIFSGENFSDE
jgi:hypothetical protein